MKHNLHIYSLIIVILFSCNNENYQPDGLIKMTEKELIERAHQKRLPRIENIVIKNQRGDIIPTDSILKLPNMEDWTTDSYVDKNGIVKELVLRKATPKDKELKQKITEIYENPLAIEMIYIDCEKKREILQKVFDSDQVMRTNGGNINSDIDRHNLATIISLIEKCGMPTLKEINDAQMSAIWLVFQHGDNASRKKYLPLLEKSAKMGDLKATQIAMMKDRTLMEEGKPQVYGTQVMKKGDKWFLYNLNNPETVNKRRAELGFEPLQNYLERWNIEFTIQQIE